MEIDRAKAGNTDSLDQATIFEATGISKSFGGVHALVDVRLDCRKGEVHALLGENGAGKSTLVKILSGVVQPNAGEMRVSGRKIFIESPQKAISLGIAAVFQELSMIPELSVAENIYLGHEPLNALGLIDHRKMIAMSSTLLGELGFKMDSESIVSDLPLAQRQLVEIAKVISKNPQIVIFDEATSALGSHEVELLFSVIRRLTREGKAIIFISHRMEEVRGIADRATVLRDARNISTFEMGSVKNEEIVRWIAGRGLKSSTARRVGMPEAEVALEIRGLNSGRSLVDINLDLHKGEILGLAGLQGHGQSAFIRTLFGAYPVDAGEIKVFGTRHRIANPRAALRAGIALVPEDRKNEALLPARSIRENTALMTIDSRTILGFISSKSEQAAVRQSIDTFNIKVHDMELAVNSLSGGNQQKVAIAKTLLTKARVLLLADPTRGIDVETKAEIYELIKDLANKGTAILFYSTELAELITLCDRVAVFKEGRIAVILQGKDISEHAIINFTLGIAD